MEARLLMLTSIIASPDQGQRPGHLRSRWTIVATMATLPALGLLLRRFERSAVVRVKRFHITYKPAG